MKKHLIPFQEEREPDYDTCAIGVLGSVKMRFWAMNVADERLSGLRAYIEERFLRCVGRQLHFVKLEEKASAHFGRNDRPGWTVWNTRSERDEK